MDKKIYHKKTSKKSINRKKLQWLISIISLLTIIIISYLWYEDTKEINDLSLIGKGENVIVQVHDPG